LEGYITCLNPVSVFIFAVEEERAKLFEGSSDSDKPRMRTPQEILTKYKFGGVISFALQFVVMFPCMQAKLGPLQDAAAAAAHAKEKLMQRQERLEVQSLSDTLRLVSVVDDSLGDPMPSL
jgi:hypothetical protein